MLQLLAFETYRDLVKLLQQNVSEEQGLIAAELRNIEERASARSAAAAAVGIQAGQAAGPTPSAAPAGEQCRSALFTPQCILRSCMIQNVVSLYMEQQC